MPRIRPGLLDCVVYLYATEADAQAGTPKGGTGFLVGVSHAPIPGGPPGSITVKFGQPGHLYVVTAAHVINQGYTTMRINTKDGGAAVLPLPSPDNWFHHPDGCDVAVCPIDLSPSVYEFDLIPREEFIVATDCVLDENARVGPGDDAFFVGRFNTHEGQRQNQPTVRFGNVAALPGDPIESESGIKQESFLVEARSLSGYSGSPVFACGLPYLSGSGPLSPMAAAVFMGLDWCHLRSFERVRDEHKNLLGEELYVRQNLGMMGVIPAWRIAEVLDLKELINMRRKREQEHRKRTEHVELDTAKSEDQAMPGRAWGREEFMRDLKKASKRLDRPARSKRSRGRS